MPASATVLTRRPSAWWAAAAALVVAFVVSRALLVATSYDSVANWEEPVFLYGALEIHEHGIASTFDYQDDLNHGGSVPLMLIASEWVPVFGARLDMLKGVFDGVVKLLGIKEPVAV